MQKISAGILLYRFHSGEIQFLLVHPGGPFFKKKDYGAWTIPKGEPNDAEDLTECALREFKEETGIELHEPLTPLTPVKQKGGKTVFAWACHKNVSTNEIVSNSFQMEWPPHSGRQQQQFPEIDRAEWFSSSIALDKINPAQRALILEAAEKVSTML